jgi:hypothetical protein
MLGKYTVSSVNAALLKYTNLWLKRVSVMKVGGSYLGILAYTWDSEVGLWAPYLMGLPTVSGTVDILNL